MSHSRKAALLAAGLIATVSVSACRPAAADSAKKTTAQATVTSAEGPQAGPAAFGRSASESAGCLKRWQTRLDSAAAAQTAAKSNPGSGRNAVFAKKRGWFKTMPAFKDGAILPCSRVVAYYGNPRSTKMGVLGEYPKDEMLRRFDRQVEAWKQADPKTPVVPAFHLISVVAQGDPGKSGKYRMIMPDTVVNEVYGWAKQKHAILIVDIQVGQDDIRNLLPRFDWVLKNPDVHLAVDPEFYMRGGVKPGRKIGTMTAADINYVIGHLSALVAKEHLPPKLLVVHRFTRPMVRNYRDIRLDPNVLYVSNMDGWGQPWLKYDSFSDYIVDEPIQFTGWKGFYHNDTKKGDPIIPPSELMKLHPVPLYIQYQ